MGMRTPCKKQVMCGFLASGYVQVHIDPRREGVRLPPVFLKETHLRLDYGDALVIPTDDIVVDDAGIRCTLSFAREPYDTFVPWSAVFYIATPGGGAAMWASDFPAEQRPALEKAMTAAGMEAAAPTPTTETPTLTPPPSRARPDWLKVV